MRHRQGWQIPFVSCFHKGDRGARQILHRATETQICPRPTCMYLPKSKNMTHTQLWTAPRHDDRVAPPIEPRTVRAQAVGFRRMSPEPAERTQNKLQWLSQVVGPREGALTVVDFRWNCSLNSELNISCTPAVPSDVLRASERLRY